MSGKAHKRNRPVEEEIEEATVLPDTVSNLLAAARAPLALLSAHKWKAVSVAAVAVLGVAIGTGLLDIGKLTSLMSPAAPQQTADGSVTAPDPQSVLDQSPKAPARTRTAEAAPAKPWPVSAPELKTCFTPGENCVGVIVAAIDGAKSEILVQSNNLTAKPLIKALGRAHQRGVKVRVILDKADEHRHDRAGSWLIAERILPQVDTGVASAHNKVMIIDRDTVVTGSFNFTTAAQKNNAENVLLIKGHADIAAAYAQNWDRRLKSSRPYYGTMAPVM
jgi:phosphatidylserine/phosphatidylglycerophosphate/cardiolipin synthase-like enzyme